MFGYLSWYFVRRHKEYKSGHQSLGAPWNAWRRVTCMWLASLAKKWAQQEVGVPGIQQQSKIICLIEEVDNFCTQFADVCDTLILALRSIQWRGKSKYKIYSKVLDTQVVGGLPQRRRRFYCVGLNRQYCRQPFGWPARVPCADVDEILRISRLSRNAIRGPCPFASRNDIISLKNFLTAMQQIQEKGLPHSPQY